MDLRGLELRARHAVLSNLSQMSYELGSQDSNFSLILLRSHTAKINALQTITILETKPSRIIRPARRPGAPGEWLAVELR